VFAFKAPEQLVRFPQTCCPKPIEASATEFRREANDGKQEGRGKRNLDLMAEGSLNPRCSAVGDDGPGAVGNVELSDDAIFHAVAGGVGSRWIAADLTRVG